jgi:hypothetical protein
MKEAFPISGQITVVIPAHRCHPMARHCNHSSVHIIQPGNRTMCSNRDCSEWNHHEMNLFELSKKRCLDHLVCKSCWRMLHFYITQAYEPYAMNWDNPSNPIIFNKEQYPASYSKGKAL